MLQGYKLVGRVRDPCSQNVDHLSAEDGCDTLNPLAWNYLNLLWKVVSSDPYAL